MPVTVIQYRDGHRITGLAPEVIHNELERLRQKYGKKFTPKQVVRENRTPRAPLHKAFNWDDKACGDIVRENQAREIMRSVVIIKLNDNDEIIERIEPAYISIAKPYDRSGPAYMATMDAMADPEVRLSVMETAHSVLEGWVKRYRYLEELAADVPLVAKAEARIAKKIKTLNARQTRPKLTKARKQRAG